MNDIRVLEEAAGGKRPERDLLGEQSREQIVGPDRRYKKYVSLLECVYKERLGATCAQLLLHGGRRLPVAHRILQEIPRRHGGRRGVNPKPGEGGGIGLLL